MTLPAAAFLAVIVLWAEWILLDAYSSRRYREEWKP